MYDIAVISEKGGRSYNEDSVLVWQDRQGTLVSLADGLGGLGNGQLASQTANDAMRHVFDEWDETEGFQPLLERYFVKANGDVLAMQSSDCKAKTTLVTLLLPRDGIMAGWAHLGDSRLYHFEEGRQVFCTFDHSVSRMAVLAREITMDEIRFHPDRNKLLKAVGEERAYKPEYGECRLDDGKRHAFLLCTDGFWEYVTEEEMERGYLVTANADEWIHFMKDILEKKVSGKNDNYSAIAIRMGELR